MSPSEYLTDDADKRGPRRPLSDAGGPGMQPVPARIGGRMPKGDLTTTEFAGYTDPMGIRGGVRIHGVSPYAQEPGMA